MRTEDSFLKEGETIPSETWVRNVRKGQKAESVSYGACAEKIALHLLTGYTLKVLDIMKTHVVLLDIKFILFIVHFYLQ